MAKSSAKRPAELDRADREPTPRTPVRAAAPGPRATPKTAERPAPAASRTAANKTGDTARPVAPAAANRERPDTRPAASPSRGDAAAAASVVAKPSQRALDAAEAVRMEKADIGLTIDQRAGVSRILNKALSDEHVLYVRTRNYHWNVTGMHFKSLHEFFEEQYKALEAAIDEIAERTRSLGFRAIGSMSEFLQHARLPEQAPAEVPDAVQMLRNLLADHESIIKHLRDDVDTCDEDFEDAGTADFLTGMMEAHEKMAWMIRAYLS